MSTSNITYRSLFAEPGRAGFLTATALGRMPSAMKALACIMLVQQLTGSYGIAGLVGATATLVAAILAPILGRLIDVRGERGVLLWAMMAHIIGVMALIAAAYSDLPSASMLVGAAILGGSSVQFGSLSRVRWVRALGRGRALERAYSLESVIDEMGFIFGPMLVIPLCIQVHPTAGILASMALTIVGTLLLLHHSRANAPVRISTSINSSPDGQEKSVILLPTMQIVATTMVFGGILLGGAEIVIVAFAEHHNSAGSASFMVATFAIGSLLGAIVYGARRWPGSTATKLWVTFWWLGLGAVPILLAPDISTMTIAVFIAGVAISPSLITANLFVEQIAPKSKLTEAFTWMSSAGATGGALGSIFAGYLIDEFGVRGGQWITVAGGIAAGLTITIGWKLLRASESDP